jgi:hypothetical protein
MIFFYVMLFLYVGYLPNLCRFFFGEFDGVVFGM